ncbi:hypothetical protein [Runella aurantiaca]|uniref:Uncharacterized protein n=1 Tax=Runella aurantiaca TaxID=2282308 RepID=A0A369I764_9BACT|nr:hypothetical protein [Runella aurantiaca]RDB05609.1 hypothetical protein DVG78_13615 [Runella aurantiaca]
MFPTIQAQHLQPAAPFRFPGKRKWRVAKEVAFLKTDHPQFKGKLIIVLDNCKQYVVDPTREVELFSSC